MEDVAAASRVALQGYEHRVGGKASRLVLCLMVARWTDGDGGDGSSEELKWAGVASAVCCLLSAFLLLHHVMLHLRQQEQQSKTGCGCSQNRAVAKS